MEETLLVGEIVEPIPNLEELTKDILRIMLRHGFTVAQMPKAMVNEINAVVSDHEKIARDTYADYD